MPKYHLPVLFLLIGASFLAGCGASAADIFQPEGDSLLGYSVDSIVAGEAYPVGLTADRAGDTFFIGFHGMVEKGRLDVVLEDEEGRVLWNPGSFSEKLSISDYFQAPAEGSYRLGVRWDGSAKGKIEYWWRKMAPIPADGIPWQAYLGGAGMIAVAIGFLGYALRLRLAWKFLGFGAVAWFLAVFIKNILTSLFSQSMYQYIYGSVDWGIASLLFSLYVGLLTGVTEVLFFWLVFRYTAIGRMNWKQALAFGIGFGVFEAFFIGVNGILDLQTVAQASADAYTQSVWTNILAAANPLVALASVSERFFTILIHIFCMAALLYAVNQREWRWIPAAFAVKWGLDAVAGYSQIWGGLFSITRIWTVEGWILLLGVACWWGIRKISQQYPEVQQIIAPGKGRVV